MIENQIDFGDPRKAAFFKLLMHIIRLTEEHYNVKEVIKLLQNINFEGLDQETSRMLVEYIKDITKTSITNNTILLIAWIDAILKAYGIKYEIRYEEFPDNLTIRDAIILLKPLIDDLIKLAKYLGVLPSKQKKIDINKVFEANRIMFSKKEIKEEDEAE